MHKGRKIAALIGDPNKHEKEIYEIATQLNGRGFLVIIPFRPAVMSDLLLTFNQFEAQDIQETAIDLADLIVMVNVSGITDEMEYVAGRNRNKDIVWIQPTEDAPNED